MESDFAALVLSGQDPLECISVIYQFTTKFNEYDISECRMIIILAFVNQKWCAYYWDMGEMKVHIIDPLYGLEVNRPIEDIHRINVEKIQSCLAKIIFLIFEDWKVNWSAFQKNYVKPIISNPKRL